MINFQSWSFSMYSFGNGFLYLVKTIGEKVPTMTPEWKAANKEYMKFQKMNPITGNKFIYVWYQAYIIYVDTILIKLHV